MQNIYGNWYGYINGDRVASFANTNEYTQEQRAEQWLAEMSRQLAVAKQKLAEMGLETFEDYTERAKQENESHE